MRINLQLISAFLVGVATGAGAMFIYKKKHPEVVTVTEYYPVTMKKVEDKGSVIENATKEAREIIEKAGKELKEINDKVTPMTDYKKYSEISKGYKFTESGLKPLDLTKLKDHFEEGNHIADKESEVEPEKREEESEEDEDIEIVSNDGFVLDSNDFDYYGVTRFKDDVYIDEYSEVLEDIEDHIGKKAHEMLKDGETEFTVKNYLKGNLYEITQEDQTYEEFLEMTRAMRDED
nr:MAG TPA: YtxH-like protein [Caudoviricetes sp.]